MKRSIVLLWIVSSLLVSCATKNDSSVIPVTDAESISFLDEMTGGRTYVLLEESSIDAVVLDIDKVMVDDGKLFIQHSPSSSSFNFEENVEISVFDMDGRFLNKIGRKGRARNEYVNLETWCLDTRRKEVVIVDSDFKTMKRYTYDGTFVSSVTLKEYAPMWNLMYVNGKLYANMLLPNKVADDIIVFKDDGSFVPLMTPRANMLELGPFSGGGGMGNIRQIINPSLESFYHLRLYDNVLYRIQDDKAHPCGSFDFIQTVDENDKDFYLATDLLIGRPEKCLETGSKFIFHCLEVNSDRMLVGEVYYVYDKSTQKCTRYKAVYDDNVGTISHRFNIVGIDGETIITRATPDGARYILKNLADKVPQSDLQILQKLAERENEALIFFHP